MVLVRQKYLAVLISVGCSLAIGCSGDQSSEPSTTAQAPIFDLPDDLLNAAWPVRYSTVESLGLFTSTPAQTTGWRALYGSVQPRDYRGAVGSFGSAPSMELARAHAELSGVYRQGALLALNSILQTYGETPMETDPVEKAHLLAMAYAVNGDLEHAREESKKMNGLDTPVQEWHGPWRDWLSGNALWPPDLSGLPITLPPTELGLAPQVEMPPHYGLVERVEEKTVLEMGDPAVLIALALWHESAANLAAPEHHKEIDVYLARYRLPIEEPVTNSVPLSNDFLFGSDFLVGMDGPFMAAVMGGNWREAIDEYKENSLLAAMVAAVEVDGHMSVDKSEDLVHYLKQEMRDRAALANGGEVVSFQNDFADIALVGTLRNLAIIAEVRSYGLEGDERERRREVSGRLYIAAYEKSESHTACPTGLLSLAAWDASNRYPVRAQEILHNHLVRFPSLVTARYGLNILGLRVNREQAGQRSGT